MTIEDIDSIDFVGIDKKTGEVVFTISDHLSWDHEGHERLLQKKIQTYLSFVESKEILEHVPEANEATVRIDIVAKFPWPQWVDDGIERAGRASGIEITIQLLGPS